MNNIADLLKRDLKCPIEEVIQVDQAEEASVLMEISEYVATDSIRKHYRTLLDAIASAGTEPNESIGVWVSGFFGSGKSSFAKNLGYALHNKAVCGQSFGELFQAQLQDEQISNLLTLINRTIPTGVILFEVAKEVDSRLISQRISELIYTMLLKELGYADDFDIAELEITLEAEEKLDEFMQICQEKLERDWFTARAGSHKVSVASHALYYLNPTVYTTPDSWAHGLRGQDTKITTKKVVERTFELWGRRRPGQALIFIIDEVGQYVARHSEKIEDLRAVIEEFGKVGKNLALQRKIIAPGWIVVTSQEKLDEVVAAIDDKKIDIAKLQDRFRHRVDLAPSDIREVATKRVLAKKTDALPILNHLFQHNQGRLNEAVKLERTARRTDITCDSFSQFYPYLPHYIDLCISIVSGIRLQPGAPKHYGGSNRTIIKQAYEMLVSDRTALASQSIGTLVTLDKVYELVEGNLSSERRTDIYQISECFPTVPPAQNWTLRTAKVICLLEFIRDLPRTPRNIAALLVDRVDQTAPIQEVEQAIDLLEKAQFIRLTEEGWKLQTAQEKNWTNERNSYLAPRPRERHEITRSSIRQIFQQTNLKNHRYLQRTFKLGITLDDTVLIPEDDLTLHLNLVDQSDEISAKIEQLRPESQQTTKAQALYWVSAHTSEIDDLIAQVYASNQMITKYEELRTKGNITDQERSCLQDEMNDRSRYSNRLLEKFTSALEQGTGLFQGFQSDASELGKNWAEILPKLIANILPTLYPQLALANCPLTGNEAEEILKTTNMQSLSQVFFRGENGLHLISKTANKFVINTQAPILREVADYLRNEHSYGNKDTRTGKALEQKFARSPYGWDRDILRLILATLFRAGEIEISHQGSRYNNPQDPLARPCLTNILAFRSSLFSPRQAISLRTLTQAVNQLESLTGEEVDVEESAIANALKKLAQVEQEKIYPLLSTAQKYELPITDLIKAYQQTWRNIQNSVSDDCIRTLVETGTELATAKEQVRTWQTFLQENRLTQWQTARQALQIWHSLSPVRPDLSATVDELKNLLQRQEFINHWQVITNHSNTIHTAYRQAYNELFTKRQALYQAAIDEIKNHPLWRDNHSLLGQLEARIGMETDLQSVQQGETLGTASLAQMESDCLAVTGLKASVIQQLQANAIPPETQARTRKIRMAEFFQQPIQTQAELQSALKLIEATLQKCIDEGVIIILE
ncbi:transposase [Gloeomargarita lithophora Alchichica-D10]|uniref:Transposase n=1 Tax=Gloeomargarita lithophora Alchichica-D10 TaxID=1188229 RepID=A0A1J0A9J1_9CYAN|nr:BREX system P-loop protein BrxC [Gloeomargarita lithophora]APB32608.1 transposase [Gloeomargarita lithophora Alchichica-D10]